MGKGMEDHFWSHSLGYGLEQRRCGILKGQWLGCEQQEDTFFWNRRKREIGLGENVEFYFGYITFVSLLDNQLKVPITCAWESGFQHTVLCYIEMIPQLMNVWLSSTEKQTGLCRISGLTAVTQPVETVWRRLLWWRQQVNSNATQKRTRSQWEGDRREIWFSGTLGAKLDCNEFPSYWKVGGCIWRQFLEVSR